MAAAEQETVLVDVVIDALRETRDWKIADDRRRRLELMLNWAPNVCAESVWARACATLAAAAAACAPSSSDVVFLPYCNFASSAGTWQSRMATIQAQVPSVPRQTAAYLGYLNALRADPLRLAIMPAWVRSDVRAVAIAVGVDGDALRLASETLQRTESLLALALRTRGRVLQLGTDEQRDKEDVVQLAVQSDPTALEFASDRLRAPSGSATTEQDSSSGGARSDGDAASGLQLVLGQTDWRGLPLAAVTESLSQRAATLVVLACSCDGALAAVRHVSGARYGNSQEIQVFQEYVCHLLVAHVNEQTEVMTALNKSFACRGLCDFSSHLMRHPHTRSDRHARALRSSGADMQFHVDMHAHLRGARPDLGRVQQYLHEAREKSPGQLRVAARIVAAHKPEGLLWLSEKEHTVEMGMEAVRHRGSALALCRNGLRENRDVVFRAVTQDGMSLQYASRKLRADPAIALAAISNDASAVRYVDSTIARRDGLVAWQNYCAREEPISLHVADTESAGRPALAAP